MHNVADNTVTCSSCGADNPAGARLCTSCGAELPAQVQAVPRRLELASYGGLLLMAAVMRLWDLGSRAIHHDESLHAFYSWQLATGEGYKHDPMMHGPLQFEGTAGIFFLIGDSDYTARLLYVLAGIVLVGLPYFFRVRLGNVGALVLSAMLAFSPTMLYFSRFARNDILMAVWTLALVICLWRYIDEGRNRYVYVGSFVLALAFATKESAYIVTFTLGLFLVLTVISRNWQAVRGEIMVGQVSPPAAIGRITVGLWSAVTRRLTLNGISRPAGFLVVMFTLTLPLGSALVGLFQDTAVLSWSGLVLATPADGGGPIGAPVRGGLVIAFLIVAGLLWISALVGFRWSRSVWWRCAVIFYAVWALLYSTFLTHIGGIGTGFWQSLGYWVVQQGEARGAQPWYYYFIITPIYEFLPLLLALIGGVYYLRRKDPFGHFLVFWAATTFVLYTIASEKMPWLLVNVSLPIIVLGAKFLGDVVVRIRWRPLVSWEGIVMLAGVPAFIVLLWRLALGSVDAGEPIEVLLLAATGVALAALAVAGLYMARRFEYQNFAAISLIPLVLLLVVLSVRASWYASYRHGDIPVEMIVYTQTTPNIVSVLRHVEEVGDAGEGRHTVRVTIDSMSGFSWPWAWYLRDFERAGFRSFEQDDQQYVPEAPVQVVHVLNRKAAEPILADRFTEGTRIKHRWWFPETYKPCGSDLPDPQGCLTLGRFLGSFVDRDAWRTAMDYFLHRKLSPCLDKTLEDCLGSEDSYVYFAKNFSTDFVLPPIAPGAR